MDSTAQAFSRATAPVRLTREASAPGDITVLMKTAYWHRRLLVGAALVGLGLGIAAQLTLSRHYAATTQMMLDYRRLVSVSPQEAVFNFRLSDAAMDSQTEILTSGGVLGRAVDALKLADDPEFIGGDGLLSRALVAARVMDSAADRPLAARRQDAVLALRKALKVERLGLSYVIEVTASSKSAEKAVAIADGVTDAFVADQIEARRSVANGALDWFETRSRELQASVTEAQHKAVEYRVKNQIMLAGGRFIDEQQVQDLSSRLVASQERRFLAEARLARADAIVNGERNLDGVLAGSLGDTVRDPVNVSLLNSLHDVTRRMQQNLALYGPNHEAVLKDQSEIRSLRDNIVAQFKQIAEGARSDAAITASEQATLGAMLQGAADRAAQAQKARVELTLLQGAADSMAALRDNFVLQYSMSTQQQTFPITETRITSRATLPNVPVWPTPRKTLIGGLAMGLIMGFGLAVAREALSRRLRKRADLEAVTGVRCLGYLPDDDALAALGYARPLLPGTSTADGVFATELLRSTLLEIERRGGKRSGLVIGMASARAGDGATTAAAAVAAAAVAAGRRVLLVDGDPRSGTLSARYAPQARVGLVQAIAQPQAALVLEPIGADERLYVLPTGEPTKGGDRQPLDAAVLGRVLAGLRPAFDLIILDLPPLALSADARAVAEALDGFVLVAQWDATDKDVVIDALETAPEVEQKLLGALFNRVSRRRADLVDDAALADASRFAAPGSRTLASRFGLGRLAPRPPQGGPAVTNRLV